MTCNPHGEARGVTAERIRRAVADSVRLRSHLRSILRAEKSLSLPLFCS